MISCVQCTCVFKTGFATLIQLCCDLYLKIILVLNVACVVLFCFFVSFFLSFFLSLKGSTTCRLSLSVYPKMQFNSDTFLEVTVPFNTGLINISALTPCGDVHTTRA